MEGWECKGGVSAREVWGSIGSVRPTASGLQGALGSMLNLEEGRLPTVHLHVLLQDVGATLLAVGYGKPSLFATSSLGAAGPTHQDFDAACSRCTTPEHCFLVLPTCCNKNQET